jgi:protein-tyrosine phosphatase
MHLSTLLDELESNIEQYFYKCKSFIEDGHLVDATILVHCSLGQSRSPTILIAALMQLHNLTLRDGWLKVKQARPFSYPHPKLAIPTIFVFLVFFEFLP